MPLDLHAGHRSEPVRSSLIDAILRTSRGTMSRDHLKERRTTLEPLDLVTVVHAGGARHRVPSR